MTIFTPAKASSRIPANVVRNLTSGIYRFTIRTRGFINIDGNNTYFYEGTHFVYIVSTFDPDSVITGNYQKVTQGYTS